MMGSASRPAAAGTSLRRRYDWEKLRQVYVEGRVDDRGERTYPTLQEVATLFGVPENRTRERSAKEHWREQRAAFQANIEKVRQEKRAQDLAKEAVDVDAKALQVSKLGAQLVTARIGEIARELGDRNQRKKRYDDLVNGGMPKDDAALQADFDPWSPSPIDAREMVSLGAAARSWYDLAMKALGEVETTRHEITGAAGSPLEVHTSGSIRAELTTDDPARLHALLVAVQRSSLAAASPADAGVPRAVAGGDPGDVPGGPA